MIGQLAVAALLVSAAAAYNTGAPNEACTTRTPNHGFSAQTSTCPYDFVALGWIAGEYTSMGIFPTEENSPLEFKGFLVSVFYQGNPIGQMRAGRGLDNIPTSAALKTTCQRTSLTHANAEKKKELFFEWKAPIDLPDDAVVELRLTIVEERSRFWVDCNKVLLESRIVNGGTSTPPTSSSTSSTSSSSTTTTTPPTTPRTTTRRTTPPPPPTTSSTSSSSSSSSSSSTSTAATTTAAPSANGAGGRGPPSTTSAPVRTRPPTTQAPRTRPPTTRAPRTRPPSTRAPVRTRPPTTRAPRTRPPSTRAPVRTRPPTTRARRTRPPSTHAPVRTRPPTTRAPRTRPPSTHAPVRTHPPRTRAPVRTRPPATTRQPTAPRRHNTRPPQPPPPSGSSGNSAGYSDSYLNYHKKDSLKHETMSDKECVEYGNVYAIVPNTECRQFTQSIYGGQISTNPIKCPGLTKFDPRVCSCAFTYRCNE